MLSPRILKRRIRSVQNTAKVTRAMEMIAMARMRRAQEQTLQGRPYAEKISRVIADLATVSPTDGPLHPLLEKRETNRISIIHITSDRGLCGGLNANINRLVISFILRQNVPVTLITIGRKGRDFMFRYHRDIRAEFTGIGDRPDMLDILPIARLVIDDYITGYVDVVYLAYNRFVTTLTQHPILEKLLPIEPVALPLLEKVEYIYEPNPEIVLAQLLPRFVEVEIYHALLEAIASEQSARMIAMRNATDNANQLIDDLTLSLNKARQEMITKELLDITGGAEALAT